MRKELEKLWQMIEELEVAMMTTRRQDGHLVSRAMATQKLAPGADLWFVTSGESGKLDDLDHDPHVNLCYYKEGSHEWISVAGTATISRDRELMRQLFQPDWKIWFPDDGEDPRHGTPDDPRMVLIGVDVVSAVFLENDKPRPVVLFEIVKGWLTGQEPKLGEVHTVSAVTEHRR